jgi:hypothetical protein
LLKNALLTIRQRMPTIKRQCYCGVCQIQLGFLGRRIGGAGAQRPPADRRQRLLVDEFCTQVDVMISVEAGVAGFGRGRVV